MSLLCCFLRVHMPVPVRVRASQPTARFGATRALARGFAVPSAPSLRKLRFLRRILLPLPYATRDALPKRLHLQGGVILFCVGIFSKRMADGSRLVSDVSRPKWRKPSPIPVCRIDGSTPDRSARFAPKLAPSCARFAARASPSGVPPKAALSPAHFRLTGTDRREHIAS